MDKHCVAKPMTLSTHLSIKFAAVATFCTAFTLLFVIGGMAMEIHGQVDREQRRISHLASELFSQSCATLRSHLAAFAGGKSVAMTVQYLPDKISELLMRELPISHADGMYLVQRDSATSPPRLIGEAIGNDFIKPIEEYQSFFPPLQLSSGVELIEMQSGRVGVGVSIPIPVAGDSLYWIFGIVELEERVVEKIAHLLEVDARLLDSYPKERAILRFYQDLYQADEYAGIVELRGCQGEHVAWLEFKFPLQPFHAALQKQMFHTVMIAAFFIIASSLWGIGEARKIARPIEAIEAAAESMTKGLMDTRVEIKPAAAELVALGCAFNSMADKIDRNIKERETWLLAVGRQLSSSTKTLRHLSQSYEQH